MRILSFDLVYCEFGGLNKALNIVKLRITPVRIRVVPLHPYSSIRILTTGAHTNVPTPVPQTDSPKANDRLFSK
jgi:hypothetical protein